MPSSDRLILNRKNLSNLLLDSEVLNESKEFEMSSLSRKTIVFFQIYLIFILRGETESVTN
jgi:hypothetical protein